MKNVIKYSVILGAVAALSFCQGRRSNVFDPTNGQNRFTTEQYLNTAVEERQLQTRDQTYTFNFSQADYLTCQQEWQTISTSGGSFSELCNRYMYSVGFFNGYYQYDQVPDELMFNFNSPGSTAYGSYGFPWKGWGGDQGRDYVNQLNQAYSGYVTPMSMNSFCSNMTMTNLTYDSGCGAEVNAYYATYRMQGNQGFYNMVYTGNPMYAQNVYGPSGTIYKNMPGLYNGAYGAYGLSIQNLPQQNAELGKIAKMKWTDLKAVPKNAALRFTILGEDIALTTAERIISGVEAQGSKIVARNAAAIGNNHAMTNYNYAMAAYLMGDWGYVDSGLTAAATNAQGCPVESYHYVVGADATDNYGYKVVECPNGQ